jgi:hypothetical protein
VFEGQYRLQVEVLAATGLHPALFLFQQIPNWHGNTPEAQPLGVCSPADMVNYPADTPSPNVQWPLFRRNAIDVLVDSTVAVETVIATIDAAVSRLCQALDALDNFTEDWQSETIEIV